MGRTSLGRARIQICRTRKHLASGTAAAVGLALIGPAVTAVPAQALDLLPDVVPVIDGQGTVSSLVGGYTCTSDPDLGVTTCPEVPEELLSTLTELTLTGSPGTGHSPGSWSDCPSASGSECTIPLLNLLEPVSPVVTFPEVAGLPAPGEPGPGEAPETHITSESPEPNDSTVTFTFTADPADGTTFECKLDAELPTTAPSEAQRAHEWDDECVSGRTYSPLAAGAKYTFHVRAVAGSGDEALKDASPETVTWTVASRSTTSPESAIAGGPRNDRWWLRNAVRYRFTSNVEDARFTCLFDGSTLAGCEDGVARIGRLRPGSHHFQVRVPGDLSPAERWFHVPLDDRALTEKKRWAERRAKGHLKNTYRQSRARGASLTTRAFRAISKIVLVADRGRRFGTVKVFLGGKMLKKISLHAKRAQKRRVIAIKSFTGSRRGKVRVVVVSTGKVVRIDGIGVATR
jgi:hypothetical protein